MVRTRLPVIGVVLGLLLCVHKVSAQASGGQAPKSDLKAERYVCEMHSDGPLATPGSCPKGKRALRQGQDEGSLVSSALSASNDATRVHDRKRVAPTSPLPIPDVPV